MEVVGVDRRSRVNNKIMREADRTLVQCESYKSGVYIGYSGSIYKRHLIQLSVCVCAVDICMK